jgi:hypothetical protein
METKKRPDRAAKLKARKVLQETVVKCSLKKSLLGDDKKRIIDAINSRMKVCSYRTYWASVGINLLIRECISKSDDLTKVEFPEFWDVTFVRQMMVGTKDAQNKISCIEDLHQRYPELLQSNERHFGDRNIYSSAAIKLSTNLKNHLRVNFDKVLKKYLYDVSGLDKEEVLTVLIAIYGLKAVEKVAIKEERITEISKHTKFLQQILGLVNNKPITKQLLKNEDTLPKILRLFIMTNKALEEQNKKMINILPICRIKSHFITIDTSSMLGILRELNIIKDTKSVLQEELWNSIINIKHVKGKNKVFTGTIDTDGVVINLHFQIPKVVNDDGEQINFQNKRIIGVDPGRTNIFTMAEIDPNDGSIKKYTLTRNQYYSDSGMFKARKLTQRWNLRVKSDLEKLSEASPKSIKITEFIKYIRVIKQVQNNLWKEYLKKKWRQQRFRLYGGKKRTFARFLNTLGSPQNTILAYGGAKFAPGGKCELSVPTSRAYKECSYKFKIVVIDEFRTSKINYKDDQILDMVATKKFKDTKLSQVRGLLWCRSPDSTNQHKGKFVDRDVNAALNMQRCIINRPLILRRVKGNKLIKQKVGKILRL